MTVSFGESIKTEIYGTSHGPCIGVRIEGLPTGKIIDTDRLQAFLDRRRPGRNAWSTPRKEADQPVFLSGVEHIISDPDETKRLSDNTECKNLTDTGILYTTGETLVAEIRNTNTRPQDYDDTAAVPRPAHADYPAWVKYGRIESGGGQFSARLTAALCIAGGIFLQWLEDKGISIAAHVSSIGFIEDVPFDPVAGNVFVIDEDFPVIDQRQGEAMKKLIAETKASGDSIGGTVECMICGIPAGVGSPIFGSIESRLCQSVFAVPAVKGIEFGAGFGVSRMRGSENNDPYTVVEKAAGRDEKGSMVQTTTNHHGGILGGLSSGMPILFRVAMKPTPSIARPQQSVDLVSMTPTTLEVKGRHDPCIVPRAVPCIEAAAALAIGDLLLEEGKL